MSSFKTFAAITAVLLSLTACGFQPMYGSGSVSSQTEKIAIENIPDRDGQYLRNTLLDRIGTDGDARYSLVVTNLNKKVTDMALRKDATYTRAEMEITADITLIDKTTSQPVLTRHVRSGGGYNLLDSQYTTNVSEQAQTENILNDLGNAIVTEIDLYLHRKP